MLVDSGLHCQVTCARFLRKESFSHTECVCVQDAKELKGAGALNIQCDTFFSKGCGMCLQSRDLF